MIDIAICDDEPVIAKQIESMVCSIMVESDIDFTTKTFCSGEDLCEALGSGSYFHIIYMDICMGGISGIEVGDCLRKYFQNSDTILIYVSAYDQRAKEVFRLKAFRFLSKPIDSDLFKKDLLAACQELADQNKQTISFKEVSDGHMTLPLKDILYFEIDGRKIRVVTKKHSLWFYGKMSKIQLELEPYNFLLIHRSFLINYNHIKQMKYEQVALSNGEELLISGPKRKEIRSKYTQLRAGKGGVLWL